MSDQNAAAEKSSEEVNEAERSENSKKEKDEDQGLAETTNTMASLLISEDQNVEEEEEVKEKVRKKRKIKVKVGKKKKEKTGNEEEAEEIKEKEENQKESKDENNEEKKEDKKEENKEDEKSEKSEKSKKSDSSSDSYEYEYEYQYEYYSDDETAVHPPEDDLSSVKCSPRKIKKKKRKPAPLSFSNPITILDTARPEMIPGEESYQSVSQTHTQTSKSHFISRSSPSSPRRSRRNHHSSSTPPLSPIADNSNQKDFSATMTPHSNSSNKPRSHLPKLSRTQPIQTRAQPIDNSELDKYVKMAVNKEPIMGVSDDTYGDILFELSERRKNYARQHKYKEGDSMSEAIEFVEKCQIDNKKKQMCDDFKKNYEEEKEQLDQTLKDFDAETKQMIQDLREKQKIQREVLLADQRQEREEHKEKWTSPWMQRQYNKCSSHLISLRRQHALLLTQNRFKEAEVINQQINERQKMEEDTNAKAYQFDYDESNKRLKEKQKTELKFFDAQCIVQEEKLNVRRAKRRSAYEYKEKRLEHKGALAEDPDKIWNASMLQRVENTSSVQKARSELPSTKMTRGDLGDEDVQVLNLPPLKLDVEKDDSPKSHTKGNSKSASKIE